jgi:hypothetical protein
MTTTKTVEIEPEKYNQTKEIRIQGATLFGSLSPFDVPREATATYDQQRKEFRIKLRYLTPDEPRATVDVAKEIVLLVGKNSGKLYEIVVRGQEPQTIKIQLTAKVGELARESERTFPQDFVRRLNLETAQRVLEDKQELYAVG